MSEKNQKIYGLILAGGKSTRMGRDKSALFFEGKTQVRRAFELLRPFCEKVFVSTRRVKAHDDHLRDFPHIYDDEDSYQDIGPMAGILSALASNPPQPWLVLACDLPFVTQTTIQRLLQWRDPQKLATAYVSAVDSLPEPLCAVYEPAIRVPLKEFVQKGIHCPRKCLMNLKSKVILVTPGQGNDLRNINQPDEYEAALKSFTE